MAPSFPMQKNTADTALHVAVAQEDGTSLHIVDFLVQNRYGSHALLVTELLVREGFADYFYNAFISKTNTQATTCEGAQISKINALMKLNSLITICIEMCSDITQRCHFTMHTVKHRVYVSTYRTYDKVTMKTMFHIKNLMGLLL